MYKNEKQPIYIQIAVASAMIFFGVTVFRNILTSGLMVLFAVFLLKDAYEMIVSEYIVTDEAIELHVGQKIKWAIKWSELDMVTRTKKNPRWVILSDGSEFRTIKHNVTNFENLIRQVIYKGAVNKNMKIHESINQYLDIELKLDDIGRIQKKSRNMLLGNDAGSSEE
jgi:hypothetical protein